MYRFRRWLRNWINNVDSDRPEKASIGIRERNGPDNERALTFRIWFANGGQVIQTEQYHHVRDEWIKSMYVITDDQDLGDELGKIVTMEKLRG